MKNWKKVWFALIFVAVLAIAVLAVMLLWNWLIPSIIGWSAISYWQAAGLLLLCKLLFVGGFGHRHGRHRGHHHHRKFHRGGHHMHDMTKEEKQEFIRRWMDRDVHKACHRNTETGDE